MSVSYVIDTTILMQGILEEAETKRVQTLLYLAAQSDNIVLHVPEFALIECVNVLWKQVRFQGETSENARLMLRNLRAFPLEIHISASLLPYALDIALETKLAVYDCVHIALANQLGCPLITTDTRQASAAQAFGTRLKFITDFPEYSGEQN